MANRNARTSTFTKNIVGRFYRDETIFAASREINMHDEKHLRTKKKTLKLRRQLEIQVYCQTLYEM
jgi:hypothetical protein